jgi:bifunctional DNA-binding transcriptional regulator/antitoxin component of YhaV-PrlF toxin-antitoxin module
MDFTSLLEYDEDQGEYIVALPQEIVDYLGLEEDDVLEWTFTENGVLLERRE